MSEVYALKQVCALLHETHRKGDYAGDIDAMIEATEKIYHELKDGK